MGCHQFLMWPFKKSKKTSFVVDVNNKDGRQSSWMFLLCSCFPRIKTDLYVFLSNEWVDQVTGTVVLNKIPSESQDNVDDEDAIWSPIVLRELVLKGNNVLKNRYLSWFWLDSPFIGRGYFVQQVRRSLVQFRVQRTDARERNVRVRSLCLEVPRQ